MTEIAEHLGHLEAVKRRLAIAEELVGKQGQRLEKLRADGHPTDEAERTLRNLMGAVQVLRARQDVMKRTLSSMESRKRP